MRPRSSTTSWTEALLPPRRRRTTSRNCEKLKLGCFGVLVLALEGTAVSGSTRMHMCTTPRSPPPGNPRGTAPSKPPGKNCENFSVARPRKSSSVIQSWSQTVIRTESPTSTGASISEWFHTGSSVSGTVLVRICAPALPGISQTQYGSDLPVRSNRMSSALKSLAPESRTLNARAPSSSESSSKGVMRALSSKSRSLSEIRSATSTPKLVSVM
mmetsp:Transcript_56647/g.156786  ORF Transcript_56647/g.156786 Transcript_56647/m.156786 type:complete len:214 (+) Transcript_56647:290-931(+)